MMVHKVVECKACQGRGNVRAVVPELLRKARQSAGLSVREMARRLNFSAAYLSDVERGRRGCTRPIREAYEKLKPKY